MYLYRSPWNKSFENTFWQLKKRKKKTDYSCSEGYGCRTERSRIRIAKGFSSKKEIVRNPHQTTEKCQYLVIKKKHLSRIRTPFLTSLKFGLFAPNTVRSTCVRQASSKQYLLYFVKKRYIFQDAKALFNFLKFGFFCTQNCAEYLWQTCP